MRLNKQQKEELEEDLKSGQFTLQQLSEKYNTSVRTISNYKLKLGILSQNVTNQSSSFKSSIYDNQQSLNQQESQEQSKQQNDQQSEQDILLTQLDIQELKQESIISKQSLEQSQRSNNTLENILLDDQSQHKVNQEIIEEQPKEQQNISFGQIQKPVKQSKKQKQKINQKQEQNFQLEQYQFQQNDDQEKEKQQNIIVIRRLTKCFLNEQDIIKQIIGKQQIVQFYQKLYSMDNESLKSMRQIIQSEIQFSCDIINTDNIKKLFLVVENVLCLIKFNVKGITQLLFSDSSWLTNLKLVLCQSNINLKPSQMLFFSTIKTFYMQYQMNKNQSQVQSKMVNINTSSIDQKFSDL